MSKRQGEDEKEQPRSDIVAGALLANAVSYTRDILAGNQLPQRKPKNESENGDGT